MRGGCLPACLDTRASPSGRGGGGGETRAPRNSLNLKIRSSSQPTLVVRPPPSPHSTCRPRLSTLHPHQPPPGWIQMYRHRGEECAWWWGREGDEEMAHHSAHNLPRELIKLRGNVRGLHAIKNILVPEFVARRHQPLHNGVASLEAVARNAARAQAAFTTTRRPRCVATRLARVARRGRRWRRGVHTPADYNAAMPLLTRRMVATCEKRGAAWSEDVADT